MIDSVLKGTGNSRFLKSAVPAGTSWADALAMLQAGTFPIDFNGINTDGFQQVGTPLNKANLLKDATAAQIGLPPSTTPDGMFQALGNTGELHVWRKTVVTAQGIPAGYTLGSLESGTIYVAAGTGHSVNLYYSSTVNVLDDGSLVDVNTGSSVFNIYYGNPLSDDLKGKFVQVSREDKTYAGRPLDDGKIYYIPPTATFSNSIATLNQLQTVTGYAKVPAETTTTYPVSTNPKAYQEWDDAKEAGYVLGDATSMKIISYVGSSGWYVRFYTADYVTVSTDGVPSITQDENSAPMISKSSDGSELKGKYIKYNSSYGANTELVEGTIYFVPSDAVFTKSNELLTCNKVQLVTGYAAIPASTTIEYLGKLGDKTRVQVVSYVGTGTYGESNPCSLTFDFVPKLVIVASTTTDDPRPTSNGWLNMLLWVTGIYRTRVSGSYVPFLQNKKTLSWYSDHSKYQLNSPGKKYTAIAIG